MLDGRPHRRPAPALRRHPAAPPGVCPRFGIDVTFVDGTDAGAIAAAVGPGKTSLVLRRDAGQPARSTLVDLDAIGAIPGPITVVDSTFATPLVQQPLDHGVDLVLHSATKGIAGHNDATLGVVAGSQRADRLDLGLRTSSTGPTPSPFDALNGAAGHPHARRCGYASRARRRSALAERLEAHPTVDGVRYPGLDLHPQHDLAKRQMALRGGLLTFDVAGGREAGRGVRRGPGAGPRWPRRSAGRRRWSPTRRRPRT